MEKYKDIINLPHKQSTTRAHMSMRDRAAQFAPFAALGGYDDAIHETARLTDEKVFLSDESLNVLDLKYQMLVDSLNGENVVEITYFIPDKTKRGGSYVSKHGAVRKVDEFERLILLCDGTKIPMENILSLDGPMFSALELQ